jgi:dephospho-CoA kinase
MWVALTGGIGSGKSTVARLLGESGASVVDADAVSRAASGPHGAAIPALRQAFGDAFISHDNSLNRDAMRTAAFADPKVRERLEAIVHPIVRDEMLRQAQAADSAWVVFDIPLIHAQSPWRAAVHQVWVVDCSEATQKERVKARSGWDEATVDRVMAAQPTRLQRRALADAVLLNDAPGVETLAQSVRAWIEAMKAAGIIRA